MGQTARPSYRFDALPIDPIDPGTTLLVTGPSIGGTRELTMQLLGAEDDGVLLVSADLDGPNAIDAYERLNGPFDPARMAVVDCTQHGETDPSQNVCAVGTPGDLTGIGMHYSRLYEELHGARVDQVRTALYTLTTVLPYVDEIQPVYRFLHSITGRIRSADGFGAVAMDPQTQDERVLGSLAQPFDGQLELRRDEDAGTCEIRLRGLPDHNSDWRDYDPSI